jgi:hypothetical protein
MMPMLVLPGPHTGHQGSMCYFIETGRVENESGPIGSRSYDSDFSNNF